MTVAFLTICNYMVLLHKLWIWLGGEAGGEGLMKTWHILCNNFQYVANTSQHMVIMSVRR